jgi:hypothetical protein
MCPEKWLRMSREIWLSATQFYNYTCLRRILIIIRLWTARLTILGASAKLQKATIFSSIMFVCLSFRPSSWNNLVLTGQIFMKFGVCGIFENLSGKFKFNENLTVITGALREDLRTFMIISRWILPRMRNVSDKSCRENKITHFVFFTKILLVVI